MARRRVRRVQFNLDPGTVKDLSAEEISAILRGADELIGKGGRSLLVKILKGSREKRVLELKLEQCPVYGYYSSLTIEEIGHRVDWMINRKYLEIRYDYRLPVLVFTPVGWEIEKRTYALEMYEAFCRASAEQDESIVEKLREHTNRQVVWIILDLLKEHGNESQIPLLRKWQVVEVKKVRQEIEMIITKIGDR